MALQFSFFDDADDDNKNASNVIEGFLYRPALIGPREEKELLARIRGLPFKEFDFHGYKGKRRVISFGWHYEFSGGGKLRKADDVPDFLLELRPLAASLAELDPAALQHVLVTEYGPGVGIGWHRDKSVFGKVVGISLLAPCLLRFRRKIEARLSSDSERSSRRTKPKLKQSWQRVNAPIEPRSAYLLTGPARSEWEHSILRVDSFRYSITFRNLLEE